MSNYGFDTTNRVSFTTKLSSEDLIETNREDYLGNFVFYDERGEEHQSALFYADNNYYVLYSNGEEKEKILYCAESLYAFWGLQGFYTACIYFPCPVKLDITEGSIIYPSVSGVDNYFDLLFDRYTFEDCREFYERLDGSLCLIDEAEKTITVKAYQNTDNTTWGEGISL